MNEFYIRCKGGCMCFYGEWFGRPYDNFHRITTAIFENEKLIINFDNGERLTIIEPIGIINEDDCFKVESASELIWQWYLYGEEKNENNLRTLKYIATKNKKFIKKSLGVDQDFIPKEMIAVQCV